MNKTAIVALTFKGRETANKLQANISGSELYLHIKIADGSEDFIIQEPLVDVMGRLFASYQSIICIMATGIVVRTIAPYLQHKSIDPAVVTVDDTGNFAIALLSGHIGGANTIAQEVANILGGQAVITTASDNMGVTVVEMWAAAHRLVLEDFTHLPAVNGTIVNGGRLAIFSQWQIPETYRNIGQSAKTDYFTLDTSAPEKFDSAEYDAIVYITDRDVFSRQVSDFRGQKPYVILRPKTLVAGVGMRRGVSEEILKRAVEDAFSREGLSLKSLKSLKCFASVDLKSDEVGLLQLAQNWGIPCRFYNQATLQQLVEENNLATSDFVRKKIGVGAVCEPAALAVADKSSLIVRKVKEQGVTVAVARVPFTW